MQLVVVLIGLELRHLLLPVGVEDVAIVALQALVDLFLSVTEMRLARHGGFIRSAMTG